MQQIMIPVEKITTNPFQTRTPSSMTGIAELAEDIKRNGLMQIPVGRRVVDMTGEKYQLAFGHRRLAAYTLLAETDDMYQTMPVIVRDLDDEQMALMAWSENEARQQLNPVERALAVQRLIERFCWNQQQVGDKLGMARSTVANMLRMLNLPKDILDSIEDGILSQRQAMALLPVYELSTRDREWILKEADWSEFLSLARGGTFDSDTIRERVQTMLDALDAGKPKQLELTPPQPYPDPTPDPSPEDGRGEEAELEGPDPLLDEVIEWVSKQKYVEASHIQREFRISFMHAAALTKTLLRMKLIGDHIPGYGRLVLVGKYAEENEKIESAVKEMHETTVQDVHAEVDPTPDPSPEDVREEEEMEVDPTPSPSPDYGRGEQEKPKQADIPVEQLVVAITWTDNRVILSARRSGAESAAPIFKMYTHLAMYNLVDTLVRDLPEDWREMIK